jgi:hypothetical protein
MKQLTIAATKVGRPKTTGKGLQICMRWHEMDLVAINQWRRKQLDAPSQTEAIRRLVRIGLGKPKRDDVK